MIDLMWRPHWSPASEFDLSSDRARDKENYEEGIQDMSYEVIEDYEEVVDADNTKAREDDSCMEICGNEEWVKEYGDIVWPPEEVMITPEDGFT